MTIALVTEETEIKVGQWVHGPSSLQYGAHSEPRQVTRITGKRIHYKRLEGSESFMLRGAVLIVCDTEDEAKAVHFLSDERAMDIASRVADITCSRGIWHSQRLGTFIRGESV